MMRRRDFLARLGLGAAGLIVGDAALEAFERLTHRKVFALGGLPDLTASWNGFAPIRFIALENVDTGQLVACAMVPPHNPLSPVGLAHTFAGEEVGASGYVSGVVTLDANHRRISEHPLNRVPLNGGDFTVSFSGPVLRLEV